MSTREDFFKNTIADFKSIGIWRIPNSPCDYESESGSRYWYDERGVYRMADHWGDVGNCFWTLDSRETMGISVGYCGWLGFQEFNCNRVSDIRNKNKGSIELRAEKWESKLTKKELKAIEAAEIKCRERKANLSYALYMISNQSRIPLNALEGSHVTFSWCVWSEFPNSYTRKYRPEGTVICFVFKSGRPRIENVYRSVTYKKIKWKLTDQAKAALAETMDM